VAEILILAAALLFLGWHFMPTEMRDDLWNMIWKKDSPYD
jgi:hypothetical protein